MNQGLYLGVKSCLEKTPFSKQIARNFWTEDGSGAEKIQSTVEGSRNAGKNGRQKGAHGRQCVTIHLRGGVGMDEEVFCK
ncbi:hypothetical protein T4C_12140 [Trichinella pseudospiralis]|uniref:Uncharacterized protein n=1 Tax=Trichinella pseudospiralis TaxID=6337 RepID=A0A0V1ISJ7_TRIPS|nr:hypothetical protein T4C_12140 [Trichinella pseudospiralis]